MERFILIGAIASLALCTGAAFWSIRLWTEGQDLRGLYFFAVSLVAGALANRLLKAREIG